MSERYVKVEWEIEAPRKDLSCIIFHTQPVKSSRYNGKTYLWPTSKTRYDSKGSIILPEGPAVIYVEAGKSRKYADIYRLAVRIEEGGRVKLDREETSVVIINAVLIEELSLDKLTDWEVKMLNAGYARAKDEAKGRKNIYAFIIKTLAEAEKVEIEEKGALDVLREFVKQVLESYPDIPKKLGWDMKVLEQALGQDVVIIKKPKGEAIPDRISALLKCL